jgi:hypothetical protein
MCDLTNPDRDRLAVHGEQDDEWDEDQWLRDMDAANEIWGLELQDEALRELENPGD